MAEEEKIAQALRSVLEEFFPKRQKPSQKNGGELRELPPYNIALGKFLEFTAKDRQTYTNVLTQIYPLPADIRTLTEFCDNFFQQQEGALYPCPWTFEPAAPWVVLQVSNYGKMAMLSQKYGWLSQHEMAFGFPVAWYETGANGQRKFKYWAMFYPYIYVDEPLSMSLGRQVYGWAKAGIELMSPRPSLQPNTRCLVSIDLKRGPRAFGVDNRTRPRFLEILQYQPLLSGRSGFATLYSLPARVMGVYLSAASGMLGTFDSMIKGFQERLSGYADSGDSDLAIQGLIRESVNLTSQTSQWNDTLSVFLSSARDLTLAQERVLGMPVGSESVKSIESILGATDGKVRMITKKQVRDAASPAEACFSAIVGSTIGYGQPIDGAPFLSDPLSPDPSGGIQIHLRDDLGIVEQLGLDKSGRGDDDVYMLRPVAPFWVRFNASYGSANCQAWRTRYTPWEVDSKPDPPPAGDGSSKPATRPRADTDKKLPAIGYTESGSDAFQEVPGPIKAANFGLWIYGLEADPGTLQGLCENYLQNNQDKDGNQIYKFEVSPPLPEMLPQLPNPNPNARYVLMIVSSFDAMSGAGKAPEFNDLSDRVLTFAIPATRKRVDKPEEKPVPVLIPLYTFVEQDWDFLTEYEVYGRLAFKSILESPPKRWVEKPKGNRELLTVHIPVFPEVDAEIQAKSERRNSEQEPEPQRARFQPFIQIWQPPKQSSLPGPDQQEAERIEALARELERRREQLRQRTGQGRPDEQETKRIEALARVLERRREELRQRADSIEALARELERRREELRQRAEPGEPDQQKAERIEALVRALERRRVELRWWAEHEGDASDSPTVDKDLTKLYLNWLGMDTGPNAQDNSAAICSIGLKQIRDAVDTECATYQAIVSVTRKIKEKWKPSPDPRRLEVRFYKYPDMTISETMGIKGDYSKVLDPDLYYQYFSAPTVPGARISGQMYDEPAENLCWTIEKDGWQE